MPSVSANEHATTGNVDAPRPLPAIRAPKSAEELEAEWSLPWKRAQRAQRVQEALDRLDDAERQLDLTWEEAMCRLLPYLQALWRAEEACVHPADRRFGENMLTDLEGLAKQRFPCPELDD